MTKWEGETYWDMARRAAADPIGRLVKLADNTHNGDPERLAPALLEAQGHFRDDRYGDAALRGATVDPATMVLELAPTARSLLR